MLFLKKENQTFWVIKSLEKISTGLKTNSNLGWLFELFECSIRLHPNKMRFL